MQLKDDNIAGSPFLAEVEPAEADPAACRAFGDLLAAPSLVCNRLSSLIVRPRDRFNNLLTATPNLGRQVEVISSSMPLVLPSMPIVSDIFRYSKNYRSEHSSCICAYYPGF